MRIIHDPHTRRYGRVHEQTLGWVEIRRGVTRFPRRPITSQRFLIGAGTNCHLQLGGDFPVLHSLLFQNNGGWWVEAISPEPEIRVNGASCRRCRLHDGDLVAIGPFQFCLSLRQQASAARSSSEDMLMAATSAG